MIVLVTGATGFVGRAVVRALAQRGHSIRVLARSPASPASIGLQRDFGVSLTAGGLQDAPALTRALAGAHAVIHLAGIISEAGSNTFETVHHAGARALVEAATSAAVPRFIHMSAIGARPNAPSRYHQTKWAAEETVRSSSLLWTIFRPSIIYGPADAFVNLFTRIARFSPILPVMGRGASLLQPIHVDAVAEAFAAAVDTPDSARRTYDLVGPERLSFNALLQTLLRVTHRRRGLVHIPMPVARLQAALLETLFNRILGRPSPLNRDQLLMLMEDNTGDGADADQTFRLTHEPFETGIARYLR